MFENPRLASLSGGILLGSLFLLAILFFFCIVRSIKGPRIADRILSINMGGTMIISAIVLIAALQGDSSILDIALLYAMISFLAVVVFSRIYRGEFLSLKDSQREEIAERERQAYEEALRSDGDD